MERNCGNCVLWDSTCDYCGFHDCVAFDDNCCDNHATSDECCNRCGDPDCVVDPDSGRRDCQIED